MARGRFKSVSEVVPATLLKLAAEVAKTGDLKPLWAQLCGAPIARVSRPLSLSGGTLEVEVDGPMWARELAAREPELLARLEVPLPGRVKRLRWKVSSR